MDGLKVGHFSDHENGTGVSIFLLENSAVSSYVIPGAAPASHELAALDPENSVPKIQGILFTGGSAFGLPAVKGAMTYLAERGIGHPTLHAIVPIIPASAIYDLAYKKQEAPIAEDVYQACLNANENNHEMGRIGAGTGATVGKLIPKTYPMSGGLGYAELKLANGIEVIAYVVVNSVGDIRDRKGDIIAGACYSKNDFANCEAYLLSGNMEQDLFGASHTTLAVVFTNALFVKSELKRIAKIAIAGMARAISPVFTGFDGDILYCVSVGDKIASDLTIGTMASEVVRQAILNAVKYSEIIE